MDAAKLTMEEMLKRTARFKELKSSPQAYLDTRLEEHHRDTFNVIGRGVTEDPSLAPTISDARYCGITYIGAEPGKGAALHSHETIEIFVPLTGKWAAYWGEDDTQEIELDQFDVISFPPGVMRGFRNAGDQYAYLMAIIGTKEDTGDGGRVGWAQSVLEKAKTTGLRVNEQGDLEETGT